LLDLKIWRIPSQENPKNPKNPENTKNPENPEDPKNPENLENPKNPDNSDFLFENNESDDKDKTLIADIENKDGGNSDIGQGRESHNFS
jgi:hypothetical protein